MIARKRGAKFERTARRRVRRIRAEERAGMPKSLKKKTYLKKALDNLKKTTNIQTFTTLQNKNKIREKNRLKKIFFFFKKVANMEKKFYFRSR